MMSSRVSSPGSGAPAGLPSGNGWAGRLTGSITFPGSGPYDLRINRNGKVRLWLDGVLLVDSWVDMADNIEFVAPGSRSRETTQLGDRVR
jgi:hypothetical protein